MTGPSSLGHSQPHPPTQARPSGGRASGSSPFYDALAARDFSGDTDNGVAHVVKMRATVLAGSHYAGSETSRWRGTRMTDREEMERHLQTAAAVAGRLAHDFGNVLTGILGFTELALAGL